MTRRNDEDSINLVALGRILSVFILARTLERGSSSVMTIVSAHYYLGVTKRMDILHYTLSPMIIHLVSFFEIGQEDFERHLIALRK